MRNGVGSVALSAEGSRDGVLTTQLAHLSSLLEGLRMLRPDRDRDLPQWNVVETALRTTQADGSALALESESDEWLMVRNGRGEQRVTLRSQLLDRRFIGSDVVRDGTIRPIPLVPVDASPPFPPYVERFGFRSGLLFPVLGRTGSVGVLSIYFREPGRSVSEPFESLVFLNQVASMALEYASLIRDLRKSHFSTVEALTSAIDAVSPATHGHSKRVTQYAMILGETLGLSGDAMSDLMFGALLHDIGKLGIDPSILEKSEGLSDVEYSTMKEHTIIGERIIAPVDGLQGARPIVRNHHERWDGRGYPDRLRGEEIPLGARIVALADFYDAMTSERSYKEPVDPRAVVGEIRREAGSRFDPELAERFLSAPGIAP